jgi:hypothetical protein
MTADLYSPTVTQDSNTGAVQKVWEKTSTISCLAKGVVRSGIGDNSNTVEVKNYLNVISGLVKLRSRTPVNSSVRVTNIKNQTEIVWKEDILTGVGSAGGVGGATIFEPRGSTPIMDHLGNVIEYETVLQRQEIQSLEID